MTAFHTETPEKLLEIKVCEASLSDTSDAGYGQEIFMAGSL